MVGRLHALVFAFRLLQHSTICVALDDGIKLLIRHTLQQHQPTRAQPHIVAAPVALAT